jgi:hypothetical protein
MTDARSTPPVLLAPGATTHGMWAPSRDRFPPLDERIVTPESREECIGGIRVHAAPSNPEHGDAHSLIDTVMTTNVKQGYVTSTDMLTRVSTNDDFACDTSVRRAGIDPTTGQRYLEELAFEIVNTQSTRNITAKAVAMTARGVRRVFAVFVRKGEVHEWMNGQWQSLAEDGVIQDAVLAAPVHARALLDAVAASASAVRGLLARQEPEFIRTLSEVEQRGERQGELRGRRAVLREVLESRGIAITPEQHAKIETCNDVAQMKQWLIRALAAVSTDDVFEHT